MIQVAGVEVQKVSVNLSGAVPVVSTEGNTAKMAIASASVKSAKMSSGNVLELSPSVLKPGEVVKVNAASDGTWSIALNCTESYTTSDEDEIVFNRFELIDAAEKKGTAYFQNKNTICDVERVTVSGQLPFDVDEQGNLLCEGERYTVQLKIMSTEDDDAITTCILDVRMGAENDEGEGLAAASSASPKSCDPNEMVGPVGMGENRIVKPGEWLKYI